MPAQLLFITGTDTAVGKTMITAALAAYLRQRGIPVAVLKPVATGCRPGPKAEPLSEDAEYLRATSGCQAPLNLINPVGYVAPLAPLAAAEQTGVPVDFAQLERAKEKLAEHSDWLLIEGIGGLAVPLSREWTVADLAKKWRAPLLVVARPALGTINHCVLTCAYAKARGCEVRGFVFNEVVPPPGDDPSLASNSQYVASLTGRPCLGAFPWLSESQRNDWRVLADVCEKTLDVAQIFA